MLCEQTSMSLPQTVSVQKVGSMFYLSLPLRLRTLLVKCWLKVLLGTMRRLQSGASLSSIFIYWNMFLWINLKLLCSPRLWYTLKGTCTLLKRTVLTSLKILSRFLYLVLWKQWGVFNIYWMFLRYAYMHYPPLTPTALLVYNLAKGHFFS